MLGYAEYSVANGFPVLFFHGLPGSRFEASKLNAAAQKLNIRLIGIDRPGMGLSSLQKNRTVLDFSHDINELIDGLNLNTVSILGHSGGAPYIAACAYQIPQKIHKAVIVSGMAPLTSQEAINSLTKSQKLIFWMIKYFPYALKWLLSRSIQKLDHPKQLQKMMTQLPAVDAGLLQNENYCAEMALSLKEAFRQKNAGVIDDFKLVIQPIGFELDKISCPFVIWQGGEDRQAPVKHAEIYLNKITQADYHFLEKEGHISLLQNYGQQILASALYIIQDQL